MQLLTRSVDKSSHVWQNNPQNRYRKPSKPNGNPLWQGDLAADFKAEETVLSFLQHIQDIDRQLRHLQIQIWWNGPKQATNRELFRKILDGGITHAKQLIPNLTTLTHTFQQAAVQQELAAEACEQVRTRKKRMEVDFKPLRASKRMRTAATAKLINFHGKSVVQAVCVVGLPTPFLTWASAKAKAGGLPGILNCRLISPEASANDVKQYLETRRRTGATAKTTARAMSAKTQAAVEMIEHIHGKEASQTRIWGYEILGYVYPFNFDGASKLDEWKCIRTCGRYLADEWGAKDSA